MAVHQKNPTFAELQKEKIASNMQSFATTLAPSAPVQPASPVESPKEEVPAQNQDAIKTVTQETGEKKRKDVLIGIHVTEDERNELRRLFCFNGFSLATAYRAAMSYLRQDMELGKAYITSNGEIFRK